jgi:hypothetical protein
MAKKTMLRADVYARALCASQNVKRVPRFFAAGAGGVATFESCVGAAA